MENILEETIRDCDELLSKINKLEEFFISGKFEPLSDNTKSMLVIQRGIMNSYYRCMKVHIRMMEKEDSKDNNEDKT